MKQQERLLSNLYSSLCLNYLYGVLMAAGVLAALFVAALVAAAHSSECYSYDKKHFLHNCKSFFLVNKALSYYILRISAKNAAKLQTFLHISKKNCNFAQ